MNQSRTARIALAGLMCVTAALAIAGCGGSSSPSPIAVSDNQAAAVVIGQAGFADSATGGGVTGYVDPNSTLFVSASKLYVADYGYPGGRVMVYNSIPGSNGASADYVIGQVNAGTYSTTADASTLVGPTAPVISGGRLFVADAADNRVAIYNSVPAGAGTMNIALGQSTTSSSGSACSANGMNNPESVSVAGSKVVVADTGNNRVLIWNSIPSSSSQAPDLVLGQTGTSSCTKNDGGGTTVSQTGMNAPSGVWTDGTHLIVLDENNSRALIWNSWPTSGDQAPDLELGQNDFYTGYTNKTGLSTADATTLSYPHQGVFSLNGQLFITDSHNNRVLVWNSWPTSNDQAADHVLGQTDFTGYQLNQGNASPDATTLSNPVGVFAAGTQVFVVDEANHRVLIYNGS